MSGNMPMGVKKGGHPIRDLTGQRFGQVVALTLSERRTKMGAAIWNCLCDCGNEFAARSGHLVRGEQQTCGRSHKAPAESRFWPKVDKSPGHGPQGECWVWTASTNPDGYGNLNHGKENRAHRVSWKIHNGPIPPDLQVLHRCDNPPCVRPDHLWLGTHADNMRDMGIKGRRKGK